MLGSLACAIPRFERQIRDRADVHYRQAALETTGADANVYHERAHRQVREVLDFLPRYHALVALELITLAALAARVRRRSLLWLLGSSGFARADAVRPGRAGPRSQPGHRRRHPRVETARDRPAPPGPAAWRPRPGLGEELPPNVLMRLALPTCGTTTRSSWPRASSGSNRSTNSAGGLSSRGEITWNRVIAARARLIESGVGAIVGSSPPPDGVFDRVEQVGRVWIAWLAGKPWADSDSARARRHRDSRPWPGTHSDRCRSCPIALTVRETWDPGWTALLDGKPAKIQGKSPVFLNIDIPSGQHELILEYDPIEVRLGIAVSFCSLVIVILVLTGIRLFWIPGITTAMGLDGTEPSG